MPIKSHTASLLRFDSDSTKTNLAAFPGVVRADGTPPLLALKRECPLYPKKQLLLPAKDIGK
jgi:hypothetical protein